MFARGEAYFHDGAVDILGAEAGRVVAHVAGTEDYRTVVTGAGAMIDGECSCPAFERDGFCKHMVAVALAVNAGLAEGATGAGDVLKKIQAYLETKDVDTLAGMIVSIAEWDPELLSELEIAADASGSIDHSDEN
ncbi:SWIM zinc finger domain-containing protein [Amorphus sp. 3PC139-8]|uniref:SWIM zinc finger family protein n=1 Tax=Amorphus sp. 3PC139-8 TaxID=2735676 RepID=UPI00345D18F7